VTSPSLLLPKPGRAMVETQFSCGRLISETSSTEIILKSGLTRHANGVEAVVFQLCGSNNHGLTSCSP